MKAYKFILILFLSFLGVNSNAQECKNFEKMQKKIETEKIAFITNKLNLSVDEAQKFWPIYNEAQNKKNTLIKQKRKLMKNLHKNIETLSDKEVENILDEVLSVDMDLSKLRYDYHKKYISVIGARKTANLFEAEREFKRTLFKKMKNKKHGK